MKKIISIFMALVLLVCLAACELPSADNKTPGSPTTPDANNPATLPTEPASEGLEFELIDSPHLKEFHETYRVSGIGTCTDTDIVIPSTYEGVPVTRIGDEAFKDCTSLTSVKIPNSVLGISQSAFYGCRGLTSITIPASVEGIYFGAFSKCTSLTSIVFEENSKLTGIANEAFYGCTSLTSITIPAGVTYIGKCTFGKCESLTSVVFEENSQLQCIDEYGFAGCWSLTSITIPDSVIYIYDYAFSNSSLNSVTLSASMTRIYEGTFQYNYELTSVTIPASVTYIEADVFLNCDNLTSINYEGTMLEWKKVTWKAGWNTVNPVKEVICSDGTVKLK